MWFTRSSKQMKIKWTTIMDKSLGTLAFLGVFQFTQVQHPFPSPHKQCCTRVSRIFPLYGVGEGKLQENFEKDALFYEGPGMTEKYEYCITVPRTFVHDCRFTLFLSRLVLFSPRTKHWWTDTVANAWSATNRAMNKRHLQFILHNCRLLTTIILHFCLK